MASPFCPRLHRLLLRPEKEPLLPSSSSDRKLQPAATKTSGGRADQTQATTISDTWKEIFLSGNGFLNLMMRSQHCSLSFSLSPSYARLFRSSYISIYSAQQQQQHRTDLPCDSSNSSGAAAAVMMIMCLVILVTSPNNRPRKVFISPARKSGSHKDGDFDGRPRARRTESKSTFSRDPNPPFRGLSLVLRLQMNCAHNKGIEPDRAVLSNPFRGLPLSEISSLTQQQL